MCDDINTHEDIIRITTFGEYKAVMNKVMRVIREAHTVERKRRQTTRKKKSEETTKRIQQAKTLICNIKRGEMKKDEIERRVDMIFGKGSREEIANITSTREKIDERIEEMTKREEQLEEWERMRREA